MQELTCQVLKSWQIFEIMRINLMLFHYFMKIAHIHFRFLSRLTNVSMRYFQVMDYKFLFSF